MHAAPLDPSLAESATPERYGRVAIGLHWLLAAMIVTSLGVGLSMVGLPFSPLRLKLFNWHKWLGVLILSLSAFRLLWRLRHPPPPLSARVEATMPGWQLVAHRGLHRALYALFFIVPLLGWAYTSALGFPVVWFGVLPLPDFVPVNKDLAESVLKPLHKTGAFTLAAMALVHAAAALKHHFINRDGLLQRMWPSSRQNS